MKRNARLALILTLIVMAMICFSACVDKNNNNTNEDTPPEVKKAVIYVDGEEQDSVPDGDYVAYVRTKDNDVSLSYDYNSKSVLDNKGNEEYSVYLYKVSKLFESVEEMTASKEQFEENTLVGVKSYFEGQKKGASIYKISKEKGNGYVKTLASKLYANLVPFTVGNEKVVTVDMFGTHSNGKTGDQSYIKLGIAFVNATTVEFESEVYYQTKELTVSGLVDKVVNGRGARIENKYSVGVISNDVTFSNSKNLTIKNLEIYCAETKGKGILYNSADHLQMRIRSSDGVTLDSVKITAPNNSEEDRHIGSLWVTDTNNFTMFDCALENLSHSTQNSAGLWISAKEGGTNNGFKIYNNFFEKNTHDEILAFFIGNMSDIEIYGNTIYTHDEPATAMSSHAIGFGVNDIATTVKNVKFYDNNVDVVSQKDAIHFASVENVEIYNNKITLRNNNISKIVGEGIFRVSEPTKTTQKNVNIHDNECSIISKATMSGGYNIGNILCNIRSGFTVTNNTFKVEGTIRSILSGNTGAKIENNTFEFNNKPLSENNLDPSNTKNW